MMGRAGRPQFDTSATVVIMTTDRQKSRYDLLVGGTQMVESNLHEHLTEHINAEIVLHTITNVSIAFEWIKSTFLYVSTIYFNFAHTRTKELLYGIRNCHFRGI